MSDAKVAIITGAAGGFGTAIIRKLGSRGIRIVGASRSADKLEQLKKEVGPDVEVTTVAADLMDDESPRRIVQHALDTFGRIDFLVNNAGGGKWAPVHETTDEDLDETFNIELRAPFRLCREVVPHLKAGSAVVNIGSTWGIVGGMGGGAYCTVKAGLMGLTRAMAIQYGPQGIRTNYLAPHVVRTDMTDAIWDGDWFQRLNQEMTPMDRDATVEDVANTVAFLLLDGTYFNGQALAMDGGWTTTKYLAPEAHFAERVPSGS